MLGQVNPTAFDLNFHIANIPVRVHPMFWLVSAVFGWNANNPQQVILWVLCVFVSILIHELGHALVQRKFGYDPEIVLHGFGGYAMYHETHRCGTFRSILISFAGPAAGFLFYALLIPLSYVVLQSESLRQNINLRLTLAFLEHINLWWGLINLLPVLPLDGGRICYHILTHFRRHDGEIWARRISMLVGFTIAVLMFQMRQPYAAILFLMLGIENLQALQRWGGGY